jgi:hypothetical protein
MTRARVERIEPNVWDARQFLARAVELLEDGGNETDTPANRVILLHTAAIAACDAVLSLNGRRVVGSEGGHILRLEEAEALLPADHRELFERLDENRLTRGEASYAAAFVPADDAETSYPLVQQLVALTSAHIDAVSPDWAAGEEDGTP